MSTEYSPLERIKQKWIARANTMVQAIENQEQIGNRQIRYFAADNPTSEPIQVQTVPKNCSEVRGFRAIARAVNHDTSEYFGADMILRVGGVEIPFVGGRFGHKLNSMLKKAVQTQITGNLWGEITPEMKSEISQIVKKQFADTMTLPTIIELVKITDSMSLSERNTLSKYIAQSETFKSLTNDQ